MILFEEDIFDRIFPFYVQFDDQLKVRKLGHSLRKILGDIESKHFSEVFKFVRPRLSIEGNFKSFLDNQNTIIILESIDYPIVTRFRGQLVYEKNSNTILYLNSPWITETVDLGLHNLLISDFALHDTMTDLLQLLRSKEIVNEDLMILNEELLDQRDELIKKNDEIVELSKFPEQNPYGVLRISFNRKILYANPSAENLIEHHHLMEHPVWDEIESKINQKEYLKSEKTIQLGDSFYLVTIVPFQEKKYSNIYFSNITELINSRRSFEETSSRLYTLIESMNSAILAEDVNRKILVTNQMFCQLFQIPVQAEHLVGADCSESAEQSKHLFKNPELFVQQINEILKNKKPVFGEILYMANGIILERDYIPVFEKGKYNGHIWKYQDVTNIVQSKISLQRTEEKYRKIIENLKFGLIEVDNDEIITKVYPAFCELIGYTEEELLGKNASELFSEKEDFEFSKNELEARLEGKSNVYERKIRVKNGELKYFIISGAPIYNDRNEVIGSLGIHLDITERKKLEDELIKAKEMAIDSMKLKELFLANISHEIRTPMNAIIGLSEVLLETNLDLEQNKFVHAIKISSNNLLSLINDILDFSKIESGKLELDSVNFSIKDLVQNLKEILGLKARQKSLDLIFELDPKLHSFFVSDNLKISQVLINLINNSLKFTEKGSVKLNIIVLRTDKDAQLVRFAVTDTGIGIDEHKIESIFDDFSQEDITISRKYGGTGLGLSISKGIVSAFKSKIFVESEKHVGSTFYFDLILPFGAQDKWDGSPKSYSESEFVDLKLLVAEDNKFNQMLIKAILDKMNIYYVIVENGLQAIDEVQKNKYDLILMDIQMPEMDGLTASEKIRNDLNIHIPIIALTANAGKEDERIYLKSGMNGYLSKPFKKEELFEKLFFLYKK